MKHGTKRNIEIKRGKKMDKMDHFESIPLNNKLFEEEMEQQLLEKSQLALEYPSMYEVLLLDDDVTPMEFVVLVLKKFFYKKDDEASKIMLETHKNGEGCCGIYTRDVAETKMTQVINFSRQHNHPLKCIIHRG